MLRGSITLYCGIIVALIGCVSDRQLSRPPATESAAQTFTSETPTVASVLSSATDISTTPDRSPIATPSPPPTGTPFPSERLALAQQAFTAGNYTLAQEEFAALLNDPGINPDEQSTALYWRGRSELSAGDAEAAIGTFSLFLVDYPTDPLVRAAQFNLGRAYQQIGQPDEAITTYLGALIPDDPVNVYIYERIGDIARQIGAYDRAIEAYQAGVDSTEDIALETRLREGIAEAHLGQEDFEAAIAEYDAILEVAEDGAYRAQIIRLAGDILQSVDKPALAQARYMEAVEQYPTAYDSYLALVELVNADVAVDDFQRGLIDYHAEAYQPAIAAFERYLEPAKVVASTVAITPTEILTGTPGSNDTSALTGTVQSGSEAVAGPPRAAEAIWLTGLSHLALGQYNLAIAAFDRLIKEYPTDQNWGQAHLEIATARINQDNLALAKQTYRDFAAENPDHPLAPEALWQAGRLDLNGDLLDEAFKNLTALAETYPTSQYATEALYWAGRAAYLSENYERAAATWSILPEAYPTSTLASFGGYWQAKALLELDQGDEATQVLQETATRSDEYYGLRARDVLNGRQPHTQPLILPSDSQLQREQAEAEAWLAGWLGLDDIGPAPGQNVADDPVFRRGEALLYLGLRQDALLEFEKVKDNWWDDPLAMYHLSLYFADQGLGRLSIMTAGRLIFLSPARDVEDAPLFTQRLLYPIFFAETIFDEAEAVDVDPALLISIMRQESLFEQSAESIAGARGLMQVMPATGDYVAERSNFAGFDRDQLFLPYISVKFGAWYIDQQLGIFDDNQFAALAAYNAGPGNVLNWIETSDDLDIFVESIPFFESRLYIRRIYVNLATYRRLYGVEGE